MQLSEALVAESGDEQPWALPPKNNARRYNTLHQHSAGDSTGDQQKQMGYCVIA
jgi:hypothetical protein